MSGTPRSDTLASSLDDRIEAICVRFEDAWKAGQRPSLERYLGALPPHERPAFLHELLKLELYYRRRNGEQPTQEDYRPRFPDHGELLQQVFSSSATGAGATLDRGAIAEALRPPTGGGPRYVPLAKSSPGALSRTSVHPYPSKRGVSHSKAWPNPVPCCSGRGRDA